MAAVHLAQRLGASAEIHLFERGDAFARGIAYGTRNERLLLNVAVAGMSAHEGDPGHFLRWLEGAGHAVAANTFLPRCLYGAYLQDVLGRCPGITAVTAEVRKLAVDGEGVGLDLSDGRRVRVDHAVLCVGNFPPVSPVERRLARACRPRYITNPWSDEGPAAIGEQDGVVLVGTGLTMVDIVLALDGRGHRGPLTALSRHGLLPAAHRATDPSDAGFRLDDMPTSMTALFRLVREAAREEVRRGGDWRSVVDALRPHTQALWRRLPLVERRRFLRHVKSYWEVHRHRLAPEVADRMERLRREGRLAVVAGHVREVAPGPEGIRVVLRRRGERHLQTVDAGWIVNCSGPALDYKRIVDPLLRSLFKAGLVRPGPLSLGLDVTDDYRLIDAAGRASPRLFALGPPLRGVLWETTAVPDIRRQCSALAELIAARCD